MIQVDDRVVYVDEMGPVGGPGTVVRVDNGYARVLWDGTEDEFFGGVICDTQVCNLANVRGVSGIMPADSRRPAGYSGGHRKKGIVGKLLDALVKAIQEPRK